MRYALRWMAVVGLFGLPCAGQPSKGLGSTNAGQIVTQLVSRNQLRAEQLLHYEGCREYKLDYSGFPASKSAVMVASVEYTAPADKQFRIVKEEGPKLLISKVLKELLATEKEAGEEEHRKSTALTPENYDFRFSGTDTFNGRPQYVLEVTPRSRSKYLYQGRIWVDATDYAVSRIQAEPAKNPSIWISHTEIEHEYVKIGEFWLPSRNVSVTKVRLGGTATLKIRYENYVVGKASGSGTTDVCGSVVSESQTAGKR